MNNGLLRYLEGTLFGLIIGFNWQQSWGTKAGFLYTISILGVGLITANILVYRRRRHDVGP
jgi:hypothetical protein